MNTADMYRLLELEHGASPEDVKKAYFRLIRKYPPETKPEEFQLLREAYEALKDGPPKESDTSWATWKHPMVGHLIEMADHYASVYEYDEACDVLKDALLIEPENVLLHLLMARYQINGDHPQNAAKYAQFVTEKLPEHEEAWTILANGLDNRGWYKKAAVAFERAYELGNRDPNFLLSRIMNHQQNGEISRCAEEYKDFIKKVSGRSRNEKLLFTALREWAQILSPEPAEVSDYLEEFDRATAKITRDSEFGELYFDVLFTFAQDANLLKGRKENRERIGKSIRSFADLNIVTKEDTANCLTEMYFNALNDDSRLKQEEWAGISLCLNDCMNPKMIQLLTTDCQLDLLKNIDQTRQEAEIIRSDYPEIAEHYPEFFMALENGETEALWKKLNLTRERLSRRFTDASFSSLLASVARKSEKQKQGTGRSEKKEAEEEWMEWEEDAADFWKGGGFADGEWKMAEPYVRDKAKVGRNDPCPCGSGKKFKKCCIGKGIYD